MGYQIPANSPRATLSNGAVVAAALIKIPSPAGSEGTTVSIFQSNGGDWTIPNGEFGVVYWEADGLYKDMVAKGGSVKYMQWIVARLNALFSKYFPSVAPPSGEPKNEAEAEAYVIASLAGMKINIINGTPVLS
jgi:hypothetical protein